MKKIFSFRMFALLMVAVLLFQSCKKDDPVAPDLPPSSAMVTDFEDFNDGSKAVDTTTSNWGFAAFNVGVWRFMITVGLAVPVASYVEAVKNHEAVYQEDNTWLWTYEFKTGLITYTAKLYGQIVSDSVDWKMYITKSGAYTDFLWYKGKSQITGDGGYWILYDSPVSNTELLQINWTNNGDGTGNIKYENIVPGGAENGGYIAYGNDNSEGEFETFFDIYNKGQDNLTNIEWSKANRNGRVMDIKHFGDSIWHCWDNALIDVDCTPAK